jgi:signal transduction histidine kinase
MAQSLLQDDLTAEQRAKIDVMMESSRALLAVVSDVLDLSRMLDDKIVAAPVDVDPAFLLNRTIDLARPKADDKGLAIELKLATDFPARVSIDPVRTRQCVSHLLSNAIKFTEKGGVFIAARTMLRGDEQFLEIAVRDTGVGLSDDEQARLFQKFSQVDESATRKVGGAGLGLAVTRRLARLMGGDVTIESEPGKGATFSLTIRADPTREASRASRQGRLLLALRPS